MEDIFITLSDKLFDQICENKESFIVKLFNKEQQINVGDNLILIRESDGDIIATHVTALHKTDTFAELYSTDILSGCAAYKMMAEEAAQEIQALCSEEDIKKYGVLGIEVDYASDLSYFIGELKNLYKDAKIPNKYIVELARWLYDEYFIGDGVLSEILDGVYYFEKDMRLMGIKIDGGRQFMVYWTLINILPIDKRNADRLYDCFLSIHDLQAFCFLMNEYEDFITEEQRAEILEVARQFYDESVWEEYV